MRKGFHAALGAALLWSFVGATPALALDWTAVEGRPVTLFYPGQASWEWALSQSEHSGAQRFRDGRNCRECHRGDEQDMGKRIAAGHKLEPHPIPGKRASITAQVKFARDADRLYVRLEWPEMPQAVGPKVNPAATMVTMMLSDATVVEAARAGCWSACHDDAADMPSSEPGRREHKYLPKSRVAMSRSGGSAVKPSEDIDRLAADGAFLEYWQARLTPDAPALPAEGYILADHRENAVNPLSSAEARRENGNWIVVLSRRLVVGSPAHKDIRPGMTYNVGFAIHDDYADHRFHHVSLEHTLALEKGAADFVAAAN